MFVHHMILSFLLEQLHQCMCCHHRRCSLHHICASHVSNDNVHQGPETISTDKDIHLSLNVVRELVGDHPLNMCSTLQNNSYNIPRNVSWVIVCSLRLGYWNKWVPWSSMVWPH
jgi:hypothetical protein